MKTHFIKTTVAAGILFMMNACGGSTDVVDSGTYQGVIKKVEPAKTEIYVETTDNKTLELYFTDETTLTHHDQEVDFTALRAGQPVEVEVEKVGKRLDPISVRILE
jgi:cold shock protein